MRWPCADCGKESPRRISGDDDKLRCPECDERRTAAPAAFGLRDYQERCVESVFSELGIHGEKHLSRGANGGGKDGDDG